MNLYVKIKTMAEIRQDSIDYIDSHLCRCPGLDTSDLERIYADGARSRDEEIYRLEQVIEKKDNVLSGYKTVCVWCDKCPQIIDLQASNNHNEDKVMKAKLVISSLIDLLDTKGLNSQNSKEIKDAVNFLKE